MTRFSPIKSGRTSGDGGHPPQSEWVWPDSGATSARTARKRAKLWFLKRAERAGIFDAVRDSGWRRGRLLILAYHGVSLGDEHLWSPELYLEPAALRARFEMIRHGGYTVLPLRESVSRLQAGTLPSRSVAITFDDGLYDFYAAALPLLREFGFPATVFVTTYYAQKRVPTFRIACRYLLWRGRDITISGDALTPDGGPLTLGAPEQRDALLVAMETRLSRLNGGVAEEVATLGRLAERVGVDFDRFLADRQLQLMSPDEIRSLPSELIDVQLHTHRHRVPLRESSFKREILDNREALASWRPGDVLDALCYPSGVTDARFLPWLRDLDVRIGLTCDPGLATASSEALLLPRLVDTNTLTRLEFESWLSGFGSLMPRFPARHAYRPAPVYD